VIEIPEKPDRPVCSSHGPLKWGWFTDTKQGPRWVSFTVESGGLLAPHVCDNPEAPAARWQPDPVIAARARRGRQLVEAVLAGEDITEERTPR
jgi:hypothetical protein